MARRRYRRNPKAGHYVVVYDVKEDGRRKALYRRLAYFMQPVQRSVMEAALTKKELARVIKIVEAIINEKKGDSVKIFKQQANAPTITIGDAADLHLPALKKAAKMSPLAYQKPAYAKYGNPCGCGRHHNGRRRNGRRRNGSAVYDMNTARRLKGRPTRELVRASQDAIDGAVLAYYDRGWWRYVPDSQEHFYRQVRGERVRTVYVQ